MIDTTPSLPISGGGRLDELRKWLGSSGQAVGLPRRQGNRFETSGVSLRVARRRAEQTRERGEKGGGRGCLLQRWVRTAGPGPGKGGRKLMLWRRQLYKIKAILMTRSGIIKRRNALRFRMDTETTRQGQTNGRTHKREQNNKQPVQLPLPYRTYL